MKHCYVSVGPGSVGSDLAGPSHHGRLADRRVETLRDDMEPRPDYGRFIHVPLDVERVDVVRGVDHEGAVGAGEVVPVPHGSCPELFVEPSSPRERRVRAVEEVRVPLVRPQHLVTMIL